MLSPVLLVIAVLVRVKLGSPILFTQQRPGKNEKIFTIYKFRTMTDQKDEQGNLLPDSIRLTKFGKLLRSTSVDELPELFNILRGDMNSVGERDIIVTTKKNIVFSRGVAVNSILLWGFVQGWKRRKTSLWKVKMASWFLILTQSDKRTKFYEEVELPEDVLTSIG